MERKRSSILSPHSFLFHTYRFSPLIRAQNNLTPPSATAINGDLFYHDRWTHLKVKMGAVFAVVTYCRNRKEIDGRSKFRILLSLGQHGRELITSDLALQILSILSEEQFLPKMDRTSLNNAVEKLVIKVVPMENLNGHKIVEDGDLCER